MSFKEKANARKKLRNIFRKDIIGNEEIFMFDSALFSKEVKTYSQEIFNALNK